MLQRLQRWAGTLFSEPSSVFTPNLLSWGMEHRAGSWVYARPPSVLPPPSSCSPSWAIMNKQCPLPCSSPSPRFLILSFILSSVCLHPSAMAPSPICSADADFENVLFQGCCQRTSLAEGVVGMTYGGEGRQEVEGQTVDARPLVGCLG